MKSPLITVSFLLIVLSGCGDDHVLQGEPCKSDEDCPEGYCVALSNDPSNGVCTNRPSEASNSSKHGSRLYPTKER